MSRRADTRRRVRSLAELRSILGAMRTLALVEIGKIGRFSSAQRQVVASIERAAADFFAFEARLPPPSQPRGIVAFGSERGFCGGFNEALAAALVGEQGPRVIVGRRLATRLPENAAATVIDGATAAEELRGVVARLAESLSTFHCDFTLLYHDGESGELRRIDPLAALAGVRAPLGPFPPRRYLPAAALASSLVEHYLPAVLLHAAYSSFLAENRERLRHMEGAIEHIDRDLEGEQRQLNAMRQEEITEEIEVLLLGASAIDRR